jgi:DNA-binding transcriptional LysR family regulator
MVDIDLNLLRVFEILYEEGNVTRAAGRLHLTQSAVSHALARLRDMLGDPLFVRIPSGLQATERAHQLAPRLKAALSEIRGVVATPVFDPAATSRRFTISAGSYFCPVIVRLIALARQSAPNVSLQIVDISADLAQALDQQRIDVVLGAFDRIPNRFRSERVFCDELAWVVGADHPLATRPFDHEAFLAWPRLGIAPALVPDGSREPTIREEIIRHAILETGAGTALPPVVRQGAPVRPTAPVIVYDAPTAMAVAAVTDMVALVPRHYAETCASSSGIKIIDLPDNQAETIDILMLWHGRVEADPGSLWLRALIREAIRQNTRSAPFQVPSRQRGSQSGRAASPS